VIDQCRQEGPQLVAEQLPQPPPVEVFPIFPENADSLRCVRGDLHFGQAMPLCLSWLRKSISKVCPHFRH
jgi:hypothetical protein